MCGHWTTCVVIGLLGGYWTVVWEYWTNKKEYLSYPAGLRDSYL